MKKPRWLARLDDEDDEREEEVGQPTDDQKEGE